MENLAEVLEEELAEAFEVKNRKSLHRYILLLTQHHVEQQVHDTQYQELRSEIAEAVRAMELGFQRMDERFEAIQKQMDERFEAMQKQMDERFESMQKQMDERFESNHLLMGKQFESVQKQMDERFKAMDDRFNSLQKLIGFGFAAIALIITVFNVTIIVAG